MPWGKPERVQFSWARPLGFFLTGKTQFGEVVRSFVHKNPFMTFHLHQSSDRSPTAEPAQARFYDIEVLDLISVRPEVLLTPPSEYQSWFAFIANGNKDALCTMRGPSTTIIQIITIDKMNFIIRFSLMNFNLPRITI